MNACVQAPVKARPRLGFLGLGWIGRRRLEALAGRDDVEVAAFADSDAAVTAALASNYRAARIVASSDELCEHDLDGVVIATPSGLHEAQAHAALERGMAVFCQKPLATTAGGAQRLIDHAAARDRLLGVDFCYRHVDGLDVLRQRVRAGELGDIVAVDLTFHNAYAPSARWSRDLGLAGGGCLLDLGVHLVDLALWLQDLPGMTVETAALFARGRAVAEVPTEPEDFATATLCQPGGGVVRLACSWNLHASQGAVIDVTLHGTRGGAAMRNLDGSFLDFEVSVARGDRRERLARDAGRWQAGALLEWLARLGRSRAFDPQAQRFADGATIIEAIYRRAGREPTA